MSNNSDEFEYIDYHTESKTMNVQKFVEKPTVETNSETKNENPTSIKCTVEQVEKYLKTIPGLTWKQTFWNRSNCCMVLENVNGYQIAVDFNTEPMNSWILKTGKNPSQWTDMDRGSFDPECLELRNSITKARDRITCLIRDEPENYTGTKIEAEIKTDRELKNDIYRVSGLPKIIKRDHCPKMEQKYEPESEINLILLELLGVLNSTQQNRASKLEPLLLKLVKKCDFNDQNIKDMTPLISSWARVCTGEDVDITQVLLDFKKSASFDQVARMIIFGKPDGSPTNIAESHVQIIECWKSWMFAASLSVLVGEEFAIQELNRCVDSFITEPENSMLIAVKQLVKTVIIPRHVKSINTWLQSLFSKPTDKIHDAPPLTIDKDPEPVILDKTRDRKMCTMSKKNPNYFSVIFDMCSNFKPRDIVLSVCPKNLACDSTDFIGNQIKEAMKKIHDETNIDFSRAYPKQVETFKKTGKTMFLRASATEKPDNLVNAIMNGRHHGIGLVIWASSLDEISPNLRAHVDHLLKIEPSKQQNEFIDCYYTDMRTLRAEPMKQNTTDQYDNMIKTLGAEIDRRVEEKLQNVKPRTAKIYNNCTFYPAKKKQLLTKAETKSVKIELVDLPKRVGYKRVKEMFKDCPGFQKVCMAQLATNDQGGIAHLYFNSRENAESAIKSRQDKIKTAHDFADILLEELVSNSEENEWDLVVQDSPFFPKDKGTLVQMIEIMRKRGYNMKWTSDDIVHISEM